MIYADFHETETALNTNLRRIEAAARLIAASTPCAQADPTLSGSQDDLLRALIPLIHGVFETCVRSCEMTIFTALVDQKALNRQQPAAAPAPVVASSDQFFLTHFADKLKNLEPIDIIRAYQSQIPATDEIDSFFLRIFKNKLLSKSYSSLNKIKNAFSHDYRIKNLTFTIQEERAFLSFVERRNYIVHNVDMIDTDLITFLPSPSSPPILLRDVSSSVIQDYLVMVRALTQTILTATQARLLRGSSP